MPRGFRVAVFWLYLAFALWVPAWMVLSPGQPPMALDHDLVKLENQRFVSPEQALGEGAENYQYDVLNDLPQRLDGIAADYPDGSNVVIARFDSIDFAREGADKLVSLIPHKNMDQDLWSRRFQSESGEYVIVSRIEDVVIFIIADREALAVERLRSLPITRYTDAPGWGAVLASQSAGIMFLTIAFYIVFQLITLVRLLSWSEALAPAPGMPKFESEDLRKALQAFCDKSDLGLVVDAPAFGGGKLLEFGWQAPDSEERKSSGTMRLQLVFNNRKKAALAYVQTSAGEGQWQRHGKPKRIEGVVIGGHEGELVLEHAPALQQSSDELYSLVSALVLQAGWKIRPVVSLVPIVSGMDYER